MDGGEPIRTGAIEALRRAGVNGVPIPGAWTGDEGTVTFATYDERPSNVWQLAVSPETGHFSLRDDAFCAWLQPLDPVTKRPTGSPRSVEHFHHTRLRAVAGAMVTNHVAAGYLYVTLTSSAGNIWMLDR